MSLDFITDPNIRAEFKRLWDRIDQAEGNITQVVINKTILQQVGMKVIKSITTPPVPNDSAIWIKEVSGGATTYYLSGTTSEGARTWLWFAETQ